jgi:gliding motility-associated-like protein
MAAFKSATASACTLTDLSLVNGGCPASAINDSYPTPAYADGSGLNQQLHLTGLIPHQKYYLYLDGTGNTSAFYLEMTGADPVCSNCQVTTTASSNSPVCVGNQLQLQAGNGQSWKWIGPNGFSSSSQNPSVATASLADSGTYTVIVRDAAGCEATTTVVVSVQSKTIPSFGQLSPFCQGTQPPVLSGTSINGITGVWTPAVINNFSSGVYTFTPDATLFPCSPPVQMNVIVLNSCSFGNYASAVWIENCLTQDSQSITNGNNFFNITGIGTNRIANGITNFQFADQDLGVYVQNSGSLMFRGGEIKSFKTTSANVCSARLNYRIYPIGGTPGSFVTLNLPFFNNCDVPSSQFPSGGPCHAGDQKWQKVLNNTENPIDLTSNSPGQYIIEVYFDMNGSFTSNSGCADLIYLNNNGPNYKAYFTIQQPIEINFTQPTICNTPDGTITLSNLAPNRSFSLTYTVDGAPVGPLTVFTNNAGIILLDKLGTGTYADFQIKSNNCSQTNPGPVVLTNPTYTPIFESVPAICVGQTLAPLPLVSQNGYSGTWTPALDATQTQQYLFTPSSGQCVTTHSLTINVRDITTPLFGAFSPVCVGATMTPLPTLSTNSITGSWSPALNNTQTTTYTFTPDVGQCATIQTADIQVNTYSNPTFASIPNQCFGTTINPLPATSIENVAGTWSPAFDNQNSGLYTFTPTGAACYQTADVSVTIDPIVTPVFAFGTDATYCQDDPFVTIILPSNSSNNVAGTWIPDYIDFHAVGTNDYTFYPQSNTCTINLATFTVHINERLTPQFTQVAPICAGATLNPLPTNSTNSIAGSWSPDLDNTQTTEYTFQPNNGFCAATQTMTIQVNQFSTPTFNPIPTQCFGTTINPLPAQSTENIAGTWAPPFNNAATDSYTFTPVAGSCYTTATISVQVDSVITPVFSFGTAATYCKNDPAVTTLLPTTSLNNVIGTWSPPQIDISNIGVSTYTFAAPPTTCTYNPATFTVTIKNPVLPDFAAVPAICFGDALGAIPTTSTNGIEGSWSPPINNTQTTPYNFQPNPGMCALPTTMTITVNALQPITFAPVTVCAGTTVSPLPTSSQEGISGTWSPAFDNTQNGTYTFTPNPSVTCPSGPLQLTVTVNPAQPITFQLPASICAGASSPLVAQSQEGIAGSWTPAFDNQNTTNYTFTPTTSGCYNPNPITAQIVVNPKITPTFNALEICKGGSSPLPALSNEGISGTWSPNFDNQQTLSYTFTPVGCANPTSQSVTVRPLQIPDFLPFNPICSGDLTFALPNQAPNGVVGTWSPAFNNLQTTTYTFTPSISQCAQTQSLEIAVKEVPNFTLFHGCQGFAYQVGLIENLSNTSFLWTLNSSTPVGTTSVIAASNPGTYEVTATSNGCSTKQSVQVTEVYCQIPRGVSANNDGKNDTFDLSPFKVQQLQVYNRYGVEVYEKSNYTKEWDGHSSGGQELPTGTYYYLIRFEGGEQKSGWVYLTR